MAPTNHNSHWCPEPEVRYELQRPPDELLVQDIRKLMFLVRSSDQKVVSQPAADGERTSHPLR